MSEIEVLPEAQVSVDMLELLFKRAFFDTERDSDGDLMVRNDGPRVAVSVEPDKKLVKLVAVYGLRESASLQERIALVNRMNDEVILVRFSVPAVRPDLLMADYYLPYGEGITAFSIINAVRLFSRVVPSAIHSCDEGDLVE